MERIVLAAAHHHRDGDVVVQFHIFTAVVVDAIVDVICKDVPLVSVADVVWEH